MEFFFRRFRKNTTLWNIAVRKIFILPNTTHRHLVGPLLNQPHIVDQLSRRNVCFYIVSDIAVTILQMYASIMPLIMLILLLVEKFLI